MATEWEKDRFITLDGKEIKRDGSIDGVLNRTFKSAETQTIGAGGAGILVSSAMEDNHVFVASAPLFMLFGCYLSIREKERQEKLLKTAFGEAALSTKCIDTRPDRNTPPVSRINMELARVLKRSHALFVGLDSLALISITSIGTLLLDESFLISISMPTASFGGVLAHNISGYKRFKNIEENKWRIVDWPKPKKAEEKIPAMKELAHFPSAG